jgi:hypothetical protein
LPSPRYSNAPALSQISSTTEWLGPSPPSNGWERRAIVRLDSVIVADSFAPINAVMSFHPHGYPHAVEKAALCGRKTGTCPEMMTEDAKFALGF